MLILLLLTLWTDDGATVRAIRAPSLDICKTMRADIQDAARKDGVDASVDCIVVQRPTGI